MRTPENLVRHELIGLRVRVAESLNPKSAGLSGKVVDETRNTFVIEKADGKEVTLSKEEHVFSFEIGSAWVKIDGRLLVARPEDRIRKKFRKW